MMILTNGLTDVADEGFLKVANSLAKRLKKARPDCEIVSYERRSAMTDVFIDTNKFLSNKAVRDACKKHKEVLYIPFPTKKWVMALRVFLLSHFAEKLKIVLVLRTPIGLLGRCLLKLSGVQIVVLSRDAADFYGRIVGDKRVTYLKIGVDTQKFIPPAEGQAERLKEKYGFDPNRKLVLHVGHLQEGRNIRHLMKLSEEYQVLLVTSTLTKDEADQKLKNDLLSRPNIRIMDDYIPHIQGIYQMCDVYFFPVAECGHCIDVPLSCMEAAACGKPIVTTRFGEMKEFGSVKGLVYIDAFDEETINQKIAEALSVDKTETREAVKAYDWQNAAVAFYGES